MAVSRNPAKRVTNSKELKKKYLCPYCNKEKSEDDFYISSDPLVMTGKVHMCKDCAEKIARNYDERTKEYHDCTKASVQEALERLDKPWLDKIWDASYFEYVNTNSDKRKNNIWFSYIKNIGMPQYRGMRWRDGDLFSNYKEKAIKQAREEIRSDDDEINKDVEIKNEYEINRRDVIRMIGYDPFINYPVNEDKPILYAQLANFIDEETKNDGMKMNAVIQIVQAFNQIQKINDAINALSSDTARLNNNNGTIKQHAETIAKLLSGANALAKDNGINTIVPTQSNLCIKTCLIAGNPLELLKPQSDMKICA